MEKTSGRVEIRTLTTTTNLIESGYLHWPGAQQLIKLEREVRSKKQTKTATHVITSRSRKTANANTLLALTRGRWHIENKVFYLLDTLFGEDACRVRTESAPRVLAILRSTALHFIRQHRLPITQTVRAHTYNIETLLAKLEKPMTKTPAKFHQVR